MRFNYSKVDRHNQLISYMNNKNINVITVEEASCAWTLTKSRSRQLLISFHDFKEASVNTYKYKL